MIDILKIAFIAVAVLLLAAVPGYILVKKKIISEDAIPAFSKLLLYVASPCLVVFSFRSSPFSVEKLVDPRYSSDIRRLTFTTRKSLLSQVQKKRAKFSTPRTVCT